METEESSWFSTHKEEVAQAYVEKHSGHILTLRAAMDAVFEKLDNVDVNAWKLEGDSLMKCMEEVSLGLAAMETNVGVTKVAGGTAAILGGALAVAAFILSVPVRPFIVAGPASLPLAIASAILGTAAGVTSLGTELGKCSTFKPRLKDLRTRYDAFFKETKNLEHVLNELLGLLKQLSQLVSHMFSSVELAEEAVCKAIKLQKSSPKIAWPMHMENLSAEGCVMLDAVGAIAKEGEGVKMTKIGKALAAFCKSPVDMQLPSSMLGEQLKDLHLNLDKRRMLRAGMYGMGAFATSNHAIKGDDPGVVVLSAGAGVWDVIEGVKSLHRGSDAARVLRQCVQTMQETIISLQKGLDIVV